MLRVGVLGAGNHSRLHGAALRTISLEAPERVVLAAICDLNPAKAQEYQTQFGFREFYTDIDEMLAKEALDGLLLITPVPITKSVALRLLPRKTPLLIEKPTGSDSAEARELLACAMRHGARHAVSYNRRFSPALLKALEWIGAEPEKRKPVFVLARMLRNKRTEPEFVIQTGVHLYDTVLSILGRPRRVSTETAPAPTGTCLHYYARIAFGNNVLAQCVIAPDAGALEETYEIHGAGYRAIVDTQTCGVQITEDGNPILDWRAPPDAAATFIDGTVCEMRTFLDMLEGKPVSVPTLYDGVLGLTTAEAVAKGGDVALA